MKARVKIHGNVADYEVDLPIEQCRADCIVVLNGSLLVQVRRATRSGDTMHIQAEHLDAQTAISWLIHRQLIAEKLLADALAKLAEVNADALINLICAEIAKPGSAINKAVRNV